MQKSRLFDRIVAPAILVLLLFVALPASAGLFTRASALPDGARVLSDISYGFDARHRMDVYIPPQAENAPVILMVHGGAWRFGDKGMRRVHENKVRHWLSRGYIFVSTNYRLVPDTDVLGQADDVARALAFVQKEAPGWGGDASQVLLMGHSAGAHLVALVLADPAIADEQGAQAAVTGGVLLDSGALDLVSIMEAPHYRLYDRAFGDDPGFWRSASPLHRLRGVPAPMLVVCSTRRSDACPPSHDFASAAIDLGGRAEVLELPLGHSEINEELGRPGGYTDAVDEFLFSLGLP
jgi:acetyl esterase/lipase